MDADERLEDLALLLLALKREEDIVSGRDQLVPIEEIMAEFGLDGEEDQEGADELDREPGS